MDKIDVKTAELTGPALDWMVAIAADVITQDTPLDVPKAGIGEVMKVTSITLLAPGKLPYFYSPSTDWSQGGPLIEEHVTALNQSDYGGWWAHSGDHVGEAITPLIALCRAIVAAKLGDTVQVPKELVQ